jgi:hypothetical protein
LASIASQNASGSSKDTPTKKAIPPKIAMFSAQLALTVLGVNKPAYGAKLAQLGKAGLFSHLLSQSGQ